METRIRKGAKTHLYIDEWMEYRGLIDEKAGARVDVSRTTFWRWRNQQHRLNPEKIATIAIALECLPEQLFGPPPPKDRASVDALLRDAPPDIQDTATDIVRRLLAKSR